MNTEKLIACCGMDCAACDARIATVTKDDALRARKAAQWKMPPEMVNCTGCKEAGAKIAYCENCEIKNCVISKGFQTCAECNKMESCAILGKVHQYVPDALENLRSLN
jgi:hypothetical protein